MNDRYRQQSFQSRRRENGDLEDHWFDDTGLGNEEQNGGSYRAAQSRSGQGYGSSPTPSYRGSGQGGDEGGYGFGGPGFRGQGSSTSYGQGEFRPGEQRSYSHGGFGPGNHGDYGGPSRYGQGTYEQSNQSDFGGHHCCSQGNYGRGEFVQHRPQRGFGQSQSGYGFGQPSLGHETGYEPRYSRSPYAQQWAQAGSGSSEESKRYCNCGPKGYRRSDERIKEDVNDCLSDGSIDASEITVNVQNGEVTLTGTVENRQMKIQAEYMAERCSGVRDVVNQLRVNRASNSRNSSTGSGLSTQADGDDKQNVQKPKSSAMSGSRG